jgi:CheY-like chemotaxis protein
LDNPARILVVYDDENTRKTMLAILLEEGYLVDLAASGSEAIGKTEESTYNVALLDIKLPDMEA